MLVVSVSEKLDSHCSSLPSSMGTCLPGINWEANANCPYLAQWVKIQVGHWVPTSSSVGHGAASCGLLVLPQEDLSVLMLST